MSGLTCLSLSAAGSVLISETNCSSNSTTVGWVANPSGRGTVSLVLSCVLTLGLCVWSAMHLNIPASTDSERQIWWKNIRWTFMGVFGPELVMYVAWRQWSSAKALSDKVHQYCVGFKKTAKEKNAQGELIYPWTLVHSFYAGMGGFVFDIDPSEEFPAFFSGPQKLTLTSRGLALIAQLGHLPNIPKDDIADKSKADGLAKAFVCLQAGWVVIQVISRSIVGLPITLLEVNTLGHAFCAFVIYVLWWSKPRLIDQPTVLRGDWVRPICAYMYMSSQISGWREAHDKLLRMSWKDPEFNTMLFATNPKTIFPSKEASGQESVDIEGNLFGTNTQETTGVPETATLHKGLSNNLSTTSTLSSDEYFKLRPKDIAEEEEGDASATRPNQTDEEKAMQTIRWRLAIEAIQSSQILRERFSPLDAHKSSGHHKQHLEPLVEELVVRYSSNWPSPTLLKRSRTEGKKMGMALWCASMAYGAVHVAAWNYFFPSRVEGILWKCSAICITASGLIWILINGLAHKSAYWNRYWVRFVKMRSSWYSYVVIGFLSSVCGVAYILSRLYLVIEAFVSIRRLPIAAYATPDWIQTIPHL